MKDQSKTADWTGKSGDSNWNNSSNWEPNEVPSSLANFESSDQTVITFSPDIESQIDSIVFQEDAPSYTFKFGTADASPALSINGQGMINNSTCMQSVIIASTGAHYYNPKLKFANNASAGGSNMSYYAGPESLENGYGGGIIGFTDNATAGSASFIVRTGKLAPPKNIQSTVGAEVSFGDYSTAEKANFTIYGTLGTDGDTFGNVVFHDHASADQGTFTNIGGTVSGGDGGNTQFYDNSSAAYGVYHNFGATFNKGNGGDVAFDGNANGGYAKFYNYVAEAEEGYGGVTSFNNNPPDMDALGASAGHATYHNFGAVKQGQGGGGHTEFTAKHGSCTGGYASIVNYGSVLDSKSTAGHTVFIVEEANNYFPTAGNAVIWNQPAPVEGGSGGYTQFAMYDLPVDAPNIPTAGNATIINIGGTKSGAAGGFTSFSNTCKAGSANLIALGGSNGGNGGKIEFYDTSTADDASVILSGNGELNIGDHTGGIRVKYLELTGGIISIQLGTNLTGLTVMDKLNLKSAQAYFSFWNKDDGGFEYNNSYLVLTAPNLSSFSTDQFSANSLDGVEPTFEISGNSLYVSYKK
ncbi:MAG: hypothetical protein KJO50_00440 [Bacteroidia bacterium]|nr:hypothetical protein [Bacteroidia bacterium]